MPNLLERDDSYSDVLPMSLRPPAAGITIIWDVSVAREYLHSGLLRWRSGEPTNYLSPTWVNQGCFGIYLED